METLEVQDKESWSANRLGELYGVCKNDNCRLEIMYESKRSEC